MTLLLNHEPIDGAANNRATSKRRRNTRMAEGFGASGRASSYSWHPAADRRSVTEIPAAGAAPVSTLAEKPGLCHPRVGKRRGACRHDSIHRLMIAGR